MLYKYLSQNRISVIDKFMIRFTQPSDLNDPFESALLVDPGEYYDRRKTAEDLRAQAISEGLVPKNYEEQEELDAAIQELDSHIAAVMAPQSIGKALIELINKSQGVLSLSRTNESLLMWAHYSDSHRGFVLGLDEKHPFFSQPDSTGRSTKPHNVVYSTNRFIVKTANDDFYEKLLCYKSLEWAYEQEVRIFRTFVANAEDCEKNSSSDIHLFSLPRDCIKEIYIGANANTKTRKKILEIIDRRKLVVRLFEAYIAEDRYALNFREVFGSLYSYRPQELLTRSSTQSNHYSDYEFSYRTPPSLRSKTFGQYPHAPIKLNIIFSQVLNLDFRAKRA